MKKAVILFLLCASLATLFACGGNNTTIVFVTPYTATVAVGGTLQFTANVPVTWSVSGNGTINSAGFFTASNTTGTATITAVATDGSKASGSATVTVSKTGSTTTIINGSSGSISHPVYITNKYANVLNIVDSDIDQISGNTITVSSPTFMVQPPDQTYEVVYDSLDNALDLVENSSTSVEYKSSLAGTITSATVVPGATSAYATVPSASAQDSSGNYVTGAVYQVYFSTGGILSVGVPGARFLSMDHKAANLLVFNPGCDTVYDVTNGGGSLASNTGPLVSTLIASGADSSTCQGGSFSRPVAAVFSSDDTTAYVLSSGPINGGTQAMVTVLDMTQSPPAVTQSIPVAGANVGLLEGSTLYVAGSVIQTCSSGSQQCQQGTISVINTAASPIAVTNSVSFGSAAPNVLPGVMAFDGTNVWIGSTGCQVSTGTPGCLSLYYPGNPAGSQIATNTVTSVFTDATDDVTSMVWLQPFNGRQIMYVIEGGALVAYNNSFTVVPTPNVDIVGQAVAVVIAK